MKNRVTVALAALALMSAMAGAYEERGGFAVTLRHRQRYVGPPVKNETEARAVYQDLVNRGVIANDLMALTGRNIPGQDQATRAFYQDMWIKLVLAAPHAEHIHYYAPGPGIFLEATPQGDLPLVMYGMSRDGGVTTGLVSAARACAGEAFAVNLVVEVRPNPAKPAEMRLLRLITFYDVNGGTAEHTGCWNSAIALPKPVVIERIKPAAKPDVKVERELHIENSVEVEVAVITSDKIRLELPVPEPKPVPPETVYVDRWHVVNVPTPPCPPRQYASSVYDDTRAANRGTGQTQTGPVSVHPGMQMTASAGVIMWRQLAAKAQSQQGTNPCPPPATTPDPGTLPGNPPGGTTPPPGTTPPTDTTLPPDPGGVTHTDGPDNTVNVPPASDPNTFPPGSVVIPVPSPGSAAAQAAGQLPG